MTFCTLSETNHALTAFSIREGVVFAEEVFMISASSRKIRTSSVAIAVSTPTPAVSEPDEKKEFLVVVDEGEGPSELVLLPTPKFKTRLFASDDAEEDAEDERLSAETIGTEPPIRAMGVVSAMLPMLRSRLQHISYTACSCFRLRST